MLTRSKNSSITYRFPSIMWRRDIMWKRNSRNRFLEVNRSSIKQWRIRSFVSAPSTNQMTVSSIDKIQTVKAHDLKMIQSYSTALGKIYHIRRSQLLLSAASQIMIEAQRSMQARKTKFKDQRQINLSNWIDWKLQKGSMAVQSMSQNLFRSNVKN